MPVNEQSQVGEARRRVARLASLVGFDEQDTGKLSIVASELATNLVKHTQDGGTLVVQEYLPEQSIDILSLNKKPGTNNPDRWLKDGYSTSNTLGTGLGAVSRLSYEFDLYSDLNTGTIVSAKLITGKGPSERFFDVGVVSIPIPEEVVCGDSWFIHQERDNLSAMVADGLGHGIEARDASRAACDIFKENVFGDPVKTIEKIHKGLKYTRGAAVSIIQIYPSQNKIIFAGVGNISVAVENELGRRHFVPDNGTAGFQMRKVRLSEMDWSRESIAVMHSDGCASSWNLNSYPGLRQKSSPIVAGCLFRDFSKTHDDCTVVALQQRRS